MPIADPPGQPARIRNIQTQPAVTLIFSLVSRMFDLREPKDPHESWVESARWT